MSSATSMSGTQRMKVGLPSSLTTTASPSIRKDAALCAGHINYRREAISPIVAVACDAADALAIPAHHQPITVMFDFVNPQGPAIREKVPSC